MKRKILLFAILTAVLSVFLAIGVGAKTIYKDASGNTLFSYEGANDNGKITITSYEGSFPKTDAQGNELTWYITATTTEGNNTVHTVASLKTLGEAGNIEGDGVYKFTSPVTNKNTVSVNFPDNAGIKKIPSFGGYNTAAKNNILFAYCPNTVTEYNEDVFQETPVLVAELDDETPITFFPHKMFHEARSVKTVHIPASVEIIYAKGSNQGSAFYNTVSLQTITFSKNSVLTRIQAFAFEGSNIEEIRFPDSLEAVNQNLFRNCKNLKVIRFGANFKYFENVDGNGNASDVHQSLTHTATSITEVYLPASFYASQPSVNYRVSYAFDGCSNAKYFFTGTKSQLDASITNFINSDWTTGATDHNYIWDAYNANKIVSWAEYSKNPSNYQGRYIITDYNKCDAFYNGVHENGEVVQKFEGLQYLSNYISTSTCKNCKENFVIGDPICGPLFVNLGYSKAADSTAFTYGISLNKENIAKYESATKTEITYGFILGLAGTEEESGKIMSSEGEALISNSIVTNFADVKYDKLNVYNLKMTKIENDVQRALPIYCNAYVVENGKVSYIGSLDEEEKPLAIMVKDLPTEK